NTKGIVPEQFARVLLIVDFPGGAWTPAHTPAPQTVTASWIPKGALQLVHLVLDFDPGVWTPRHLHGGQELVTLTAGDLILQRRGETQMFTAGESWVNKSGLVHAADNEGAPLARAV